MTQKEPVSVHGGLDENYRRGTERSDPNDR